MTKLKRLEAVSRHPSRIPATPRKWSKLIGVPANRFQAAWFDPVDLEIVVYAPIENAAWITDKPSYVRTIADQLDDTMAYYIFDGQLVTRKESEWSSTPGSI